MSVLPIGRKSPWLSLGLVGAAIIGSMVVLALVIGGIAWRLTSTESEPTTQFPSTTEPLLIVTDESDISGPQCEPFRDPQDPAFDLQHVSALIPDGEWTLVRCTDTSAEDGSISIRARLVDPGEPRHIIEVSLEERRASPELLSQLGPTFSASVFADETALLAQADHTTTGITELEVSAEPVEPITNTDFCANYDFTLVDRDGENWTATGKGVTCLATATSIEPLVVTVEWSERTPSGSPTIRPETAFSWLGSYLESLSVGL
jgi:hypothetical protein